MNNLGNPKIGKVEEIVNWIVLDKRRGTCCIICGVLKREAEPGCYRRKRHWYPRRKK